MSGYRNQPNRFAARNSNSRTNNTNDGSRMEWKRKPKIANDESLGNSSSGIKDNSSLPVECTPGKLPALNTPFQQESPLPLVNNIASGLKNVNLTTNSCQRADRASNHLGSVLNSDYRMNDSLRVFSQSEPRDIRPSTEKMSNFSPKPTLDISFQQESPLPVVKNVASGVENLDRIGDMSQEKTGSSGISEDTDRGSSITRFDICPNRFSAVVKLKAPLHVKNKEKRNQVKRSVEGPNIIVLRPGMVLMKGYISIDNQVSIVKTCRDFGMGHGGFYQPGYRDGSTLHLKMMCLGKNWDPQSSKYSDMRPIDNAKPPGIPDRFHDLVKSAILDSNAHIEKILSKADARKIIPSMLPDICIVNFYTKGGKLGLHQDKDESPESLYKELPVVSFSIGDSADFLYGDDRDIDKADKVVLESGDVLIFGGNSRRIFHGVTSILPDSAPTSLLETTDLRAGRLNLTFRQF